jgi:membrane protein involved in colicin uptake
MVGDDGKTCAAVVPVDQDPSVTASMRELQVFEELVDRARSSIRDPRVTSQLLHHRKQLERALRGVDPQALKDLEEKRAADLEELRVERDKLRKEEAVKLQEKKKKKAEDDEKKALKAKAAEEKAKLREDYLKVDKSDWDKEMFGSLAEKMTKSHQTNIREFFQRISNTLK